MIIKKGIIVAPRNFSDKLFYEFRNYFPAGIEFNRVPLDKNSSGKYENIWTFEFAKKISAEVMFFIGFDEEFSKILFNKSKEEIEKIESLKLVEIVLPVKEVDKKEDTTENIFSIPIMLLSQKKHFWTQVVENRFSIYDNMLSFKDEIISRMGLYHSFLYFSYEELEKYIEMGACAKGGFLYLSMNKTADLAKEYLQK